MNCFTTKTYGKWLSLLSITLQGCTSFRRLTFHSVHCQPQPRLPTQECFHSFHYANSNPPFHSAPPLAFPLAIRNSKPKREAPFHPTPLSILHSVTTLAFPNPISSMPLRYSLPRKLKNPPSKKVDLKELL